MCTAGVPVPTAMSIINIQITPEMLANFQQPTAMPTVNIQVTPEMLANIQLPTRADHQRSYAPSETNYEQAKEAANRIGWTLHSPKMYDVPSSRQVSCQHHVTTYASSLIDA